MKPESVCDHFTFLPKCMVFSLASLVGFLGGLGIWFLWCLGFGTCWGKKWLEKHAKKATVPVDVELGTEVLKDDKMKDGFGVIKKPE
jgi:hypothetical protein